MTSIQFLEGRRHAIMVLQSVETSTKADHDGRGPVQAALDNLRESCKRYPAEYAKGVMSIVEAVGND